jgi:uncharacterized protein (TIGR03089 family)
VTPADLLRREISRDGSRPLVTWYDDNTGGRVELSVVTTANWGAKIAGLLADEHDAEPGVAVTVDLPLHWQTACVLLATWLCGAAVDIGGSGDVRIAADGDADVVVTPDPMGLGLSRLVGAQPDDFAPLVPIDPSSLALRLPGREWTHAELADAAQHAADHHGLGRDSRVLSTMPYDSADGLDAGLLVPLAAGGSVVLVSNAEELRLADRCRSEKVTHTAGLAVGSLPRLA